MEIASTSKLHTQTRYRIVDIKEMRFGFEPSDPMRSVIAFLPEGTRIQANFYRDKKTTHYFLMDHKEVVKMKGVYAKCKDDAERNQKASEYLDSMSNFSKYFKKTLYLRLIGPAAFGAEGEHRVFLAEALEVIPIALKQQRTPIESNNNILEMLYHQMALLQTIDGQNTLSLQNFNYLLNEYDIDKTKITLVPDLTQEATRRLCLERGGLIKVYGPNLRVVLDHCQAVNYIFSRAVMGVNWSEDKCTEHEKCDQKIKEIILGWFSARVQGKELYYSDYNATENAIRMIQGECDFKYTPKKNVPNYYMMELKATEETFISNYNAVVKYYNLPKYPIFVPASRRDTMYIWMLRFLTRFGWIQAFFNYDSSMDESDQKSHGIVIECLFYLVPTDHVTAAREFVKMVLLADGNSEHEGSLDSDPVEELSDMMKDGVKINVGKGRHPKPKNKKKKKKAYK